MHVEIKGELPGVFYRSPAPGEPAFVNEGDAITEETVVGMVELMKQFTEVYAGVAGILESFAVNDGDDIDTEMAIAIVRTIE
ncbi:acetyl-CoA carboxylase [Pantoea cypripedii]|uniref:Biotin carboxyl carrier protein of acetyl-CoA carboxylase n=1 Tax=Pantoea cypripedii TaxID=55209 RepID=A0A6B9GHN0_PANCY|nr:acetyl-CoA carboxylase [Pantoea cypripedii]QGY32946.1 acetyl-CoA carboxylase biotin carboxyl carrier protein subunit [Pantoea cypripedii]